MFDNDSDGPYALSSYEEIFNSEDALVFDTYDVAELQRKFASRRSKHKLCLTISYKAELSSSFFDFFSVAANLQQTNNIEYLEWN